MSFNQRTDIMMDWDQGTWKAMENMVEQGKVHSLGVSNFDVDKLESLMDFAKVRPVINQVELNPNRRDSELLRLCRDLVRPLNNEYMSG